MGNCCKDQFRMQEAGDSFQMWQGLRGPYFTPQVSSDGTLSWVNNGGLPNPASVNIKGPQGEHGDALTITGVAETVEGLPADPERGDLWLVGTEAPLTGYVWLGQWVNIGQFAIGPKGDPGDDGRTPTISATATTGVAGSSASVTRTGTQLNPIFNFRIPRGDTGAQGRQGIPGNPGSKVETVEGSGSATGIGTSGANITVQFSNIPSGGTLICESVVSITAGTPKDITTFYKKSQNTSASTYFVASSASQNVSIRAVRVYVIDSTDTVVSGVKGEAEETYRTGEVNITPVNIGLGNVNNTSDADKPISDATQEALDAKADAADVSELSRQLSDLETRLKSGDEEDADLHLGFYLDENGDLCQVDEEVNNG